MPKGNLGLPLLTAAFQKYQKADVFIPCPNEKADTGNAVFLAPAYFSTDRPGVPGCHSTSRPTTVRPLYDGE
jgi:hypothetical protein